LLDANPGGVEEGRSVDLSELIERILSDVKRLAAEVDWLLPYL